MADLRPDLAAHASQAVILHVEDNPASRYAVGRCLRREGFAVREAATGDEGLSLVKEGPDLVILDVNLPDLDGFEVCRRIKAYPATATIPVLHLSASYVTDEAQVRGLEGGADSYLVQPVEPDVLVATVKALLRMRRAEEETRFQARLLDMIGQAVIATDMRGTVTHWNGHAEKLYGWTREEALGRRVTELTVGPTESGLAEEIMERLHVGEIWEGEFTVRRKDGTTFPAYVTDSMIHDAEGRAVGIVGVSTDITERKRAEEERVRLLARQWKARAEAEERKRISRELHDRVAHAMGVVHQSLELHEALKEANPELARAKMGLAKESTVEAMSLTRNLSQELRSVEAKDGFSTALSSLLEATVPPGVERAVSVEGDEALVPPHVREQLFVILREGVRNAVSHSGAGRIDVGVRVCAGEVAGCVEDDGRGFAEEDGGYAGGGIRSMRERAQLLGGTLEVSSGPEAGTTVRVSVPLKGGLDNGT